MIVWYVLAVLFLLILSCEFYAFKTGVPTIASFPSARRAIIKILKAKVPPGAPFTIIDLGSGSGQLARAIARALPNAYVTGVELSPVPWLRAVVWQKLFGPQNLAYARADFWAYDCRQADAVVLYLTENIIERMGEKLRRELKDGALVVANDTALRGDWQPIETVPTGFLKFKIFVYRQERR
jgi:SAM-dependent methyltransferase